jgi:hypothetical protein
MLNIDNIYKYFSTLIIFYQNNFYSDYIFDINQKI